MSSKKQKLELTWIGKDKRPRLEPRILLEDSEFSYQSVLEGVQQLGETADLFSDTVEERLEPFNDNILIHGDNLLALKALEQEYAGKVKLVFIDPPYNTDSAFTHYDDGVEHSMWLTLIRDRLEIIKNLLSDDGSLWITIDDNESHYLKVLCDEVFGRKNYITSIVWEKDKGRRSDAIFSVSHDYILIYTKKPTLWGSARNLLERTSEQIKRYKNPDNDPRGKWLQGDNGTAKSSSVASRFPITLPSGRNVTPPAGRGWAFSRETFETARLENRVYFGAKGDGMPIIKRYLSEVQKGIVPRTWWPADDAGHNQEAKRDHLNKLLKGIEPFSTPKPERLLERIIHIATNPGDLVLDSFAGSGTTGAVAHKMGRRWIMVELGDHCKTHIVPRLKKVLDGEDQGGISKAVHWKGGGGFKFYSLAESLLKKDTWGNWVINPKYNPEMLTEAMCKHMGYTYSPSQSNFWEHGYSTESNYIYVTTGTLSHDQLKLISNEVGATRSLLICSKGFMAESDEFPNLNLKKIPQVILHKCEWDHDDYSFHINVLPEVDAE